MDPNPGPGHPQPALRVLLCDLGTEVHAAEQSSDPLAVLTVLQRHLDQANVAVEVLTALRDLELAKQARVRKTLGATLARRCGKTVSWVTGRLSQVRKGIPGAVLSRIIPLPALRVVRPDTTRPAWRKRACVCRYWHDRYADEIATAGPAAPAAPGMLTGTTGTATDTAVAAGNLAVAAPATPGRPRQRR